MQIKSIKTDSVHKAALARIEELWDAQPDTTEVDEMVVLTTLVEKFEQAHVPIETPDPIKAILFRVEQQRLDDKDFAAFLGREATLVKS